MDRVVGHDDVPSGAWGGGAVTLGVFDGVHTGHRAVLERTCERAAALGGPSVAITFDRHPRLTLTGSGPAQIVPLEYRLDLIEAVGIAHCLVLAFDTALAERSATWFTEEILLGRIGARAAVLGYDCRFGHDGIGTAAYLTENWGPARLATESVPQQSSGGVKVSSTHVREAIRAGDLALATGLLGRPVTIRGAVLRGDGRAQIGFPTANVAHDGFLLPPTGVYTGRVRVAGTPWRAMVNLGTRPTFDSTERVWLEAHLVDGFADDLYGQTVDVELTRKIRDEQRFDGRDALVSQIRRDLDALMDS